MTRPAMRMCARCDRSTDEPVLIHEVHAPTGPGFNVYACPECAAHYDAPRTHVLELPDPTSRRSRLTLRIYRIDREGRVTDDRGKVEVVAGGHGEPVPFTSAYPPCSCRRCTAAR